MLGAVSNGHTKDRILDAAEALFAEKGYKGVTIREIVRAAGCNVAAVNYHFGQKRNLYLQVFRSRWIPRAMSVQKTFRKYLDAAEQNTAADIVRALAMAFLEGPLGEKERIRHNQLMAREMAQPSEAFDLIARKVMRPFMGEILELLRKSLPKSVDEEDLILCLLSILSQILYFSFARTPVSMITGKRYTSAFRDRLCEHIINFSLKGLGIDYEAE